VLEVLVVQQVLRVLVPGVREVLKVLVLRVPVLKVLVLRVPVPKARVLAPSAAPAPTAPAPSAPDGTFGTFSTARRSAA
jgi:hypothetical protein